MGKLENQKKTNFCQVYITCLLFLSAIYLGMRNGGNLSSFPARRVPSRILALFWAWQ